MHKNLDVKCMKTFFNINLLLVAHFPHIYPHSTNLYMIYIAGEQICGKALCELDGETFKEIGIKSIG